MVNTLKKSDMLPGLAAAQWARPLGPLAGIMMALAFISGGCYFASGATAETVQPWLYALFAATILLILADIFVLFAMLFKAVREERAGYTTTGGMSPKVPQVDYLTGEVLREVGQPLMGTQSARPKKRP